MVKLNVIITMIKAIKNFIKNKDIELNLINKQNIETRPIWKPMHMQPFFVEYDYIGNNVSEKLFENGVCLPSDTKMTDEDLERVCTIVKELWR